jgi:hypothetical protein
MKLMSSKQLAAEPDRILRDLSRSGTLVITANGVPKGILLPTSEETVLEDVLEQTRARARRAVSEIRRQAAQRGLDRLGADEIQREIANARKTRRQRPSK